jgi:hypothetical protein
MQGPAFRRLAEVFWLRETAVLALSTFVAAAKGGVDCLDLSLGIMLLLLLLGCVSGVTGQGDIA